MPLLLIIGSLLFACAYGFNYLDLSTYLGETELFILFAITETGTFPYVLISLSIFCLILLGLQWAQHRNFKKVLLAFILITISIVSTQGIKSVLKDIFQQPRPFVVKLYEREDKIQAFYQLDKAKRAEKILYDARYNGRPDFVLNHWAHETGYSFPSGHTIYAVSIAFLFLIFSRKALLNGIIVFWAILMMYSRVALNMHYPADLMLSIAISLPIHLGIYWLAQQTKLLDLGVDLNKKEIRKNKPFE